MQGVRATPEIRETFLSVLSQTANVMLAAKACGQTRRWAYGVREVDPAFAAAWDEAKRAATDVLRRAAWERAVVGWKEEVYTPKGDLAGYVRRYDGRLLQFLLIHADPEEFGTHKDITVHGQVAHSIIPSRSAMEWAGPLLEAVADDPEAKDALSRAFLKLSQRGSTTVEALPPAGGVSGEPGRRAERARSAPPAQRQTSGLLPVEDYDTDS